VISSVVLLPQLASQAAYVLDSRRVASHELATEVAASQVQAVVELLGQRGLRLVIFGDRWYACAPFLRRMSTVAASCLMIEHLLAMLTAPAFALPPCQEGRCILPGF
jgi:hypothetical protein